MSFTKQVSLHGRRAYLTKDDVLVGRGGVAVGGEGKPSIMYPGPDTVAFSDDFLGQNIHTDTGSQGMWGIIRGADTGADGDVDIVSGHSNGVVRLRCPNRGTAAATTAFVSSLVLGRHFDANQGKVRFSARVRVGIPGEDANPPAKAIFFAGFTDDTGTAEVPIFVDTGEATGAGAGAIGELRSVAANLVGMLYDPDTDTGNGWTSGKWHGVSSTAAGLTANQSTPDAHAGPDSAKWQWLEVEVDRNSGDTGGIARFWLDGRLVGQITSPVLSTAKLTPIVSIAAKGPADTGSSAADVDLIAVSANRDTGD